MDNFADLIAAIGTVLMIKQPWNAPRFTKCDVANFGRDVLPPRMVDDDRHDEDKLLKC